MKGDETPKCSYRLLLNPMTLKVPNVTVRLKKDADGNRLRSDGKKISVAINVAVTEGSRVKVAELATP